MNKVAVIGAGTMGNGIAHTAAMTGFPVTLVEVSREFLDKGMSTISKNLQRGVDKGKMTAEEKDAILARITPSLHLEDVGDADIVVEAVIEDFGTKAELFRSLDRIAKQGAILASNTSSISITKIAAQTSRPADVIGMHFMNPVPVMTLVEVIRGIATSDATWQKVEDLSRRMGKTPLPANDYPGFVSNRVLMPMINEAGSQRASRSTAS
jgi:3-hydroxybutyryl-CoA dehydrogenase